MRCNPFYTPPPQSQPAAGVSEDGQPLAWKAPRTGKVIRSLHTGEGVLCTAFAVLCRVFCRDVLKGGNIGVRAGGRGVLGV